MSTIWVRVTTAVTRLILPSALAVTTAAACSDDPDAARSLPQGREVLAQSSAVMRQVKSIGFTIDTEGNPAVPFERGAIRLLRNGDAEGSLQIRQSGQTVEMSFVLVGPTVYYKGLTGGYQKLPRLMVAQLYDPSALLDPERGVAKAMTAATEVRTETREKTGGTDAYRIRARLPKNVAAALVPGVTQDVVGRLWIGITDHRPVKLRLQIPAAAGGNAPAGAVVVSLTEFNAAYAIRPPK